MSGQTTGWVLRNGPKDRAMRAVLVTIADAANRDGERAHPGMAAIVEGSLYSTGHVRRVLRQLESEGWIETTENASGGRGLATEFRVIMDREETRAPCAPLSDGKARIEEEKGAHPEAERRASEEAPLYTPTYSTVSTSAEPSLSEQYRTRSRLVAAEVWEARNPKPTTKFLNLVAMAHRFIDAGWEDRPLIAAMTATAAFTDQAVEFQLRRGGSSGVRKDAAAGLLDEIEDLQSRGL